MSIRLKFSHKILLAASLVVVVAFTSFTTYNYFMQREAIRADLENYLGEMGDVTARNIESWFSGRLLLLENTAQTIAANPDTAAVEALVKQPAQSSTYAFSYLGRVDGEFVVHPRFELPSGYDPRQRPWYQAAERAGRTTLTEPYLDTATNELIITAATPARQGSQLIGVVGGDLSLKTLDSIINALNFHGIGYAFLVSRDGKVLVHPQRDLVMKSLDDLFPGQKVSLDGGLAEVEQDEGNRILTFAPVKGLPTVDWYVGISVDKGKAFAVLDQFSTSAIIATLIAVAFILGLLGMLIQVLMKPLVEMGRAMRDIAQGEGDLTKRLSVTTHDEFGDVASGFNRFVERIQGSIREVASATREVNEVVSRVLVASNSSMANSDEQASRTNSVAAAINQLGAAAQEIARNAAEASEQASGARQQAEEGRQVVGQNIQAMQALSNQISDSCRQMEQLNGRTANIGQILEVIKGISEQTNLLALNAAIEAARAGEAGRGFAVVADEVRNLAHRTQSSAQEIQQMIEQLQVGARESVATMTHSQQQSTSSVSIANRAGERLQSVTALIGEIDGMNQSVATATEEQTSVIESLNVDITEINTLNHEGVENLQATLRACADLERQAGRLNGLVGGFRI